MYVCMYVCMGVSVTLRFQVQSVYFWRWSVCRPAHYIQRPIYICSSSLMYVCIWVFVFVYVFGFVCISVAPPTKYSVPFTHAAAA
jgi:hypothetical protein